MFLSIVRIDSFILIEQLQIRLIERVQNSLIMILDLLLTFSSESNGQLCVS
jgi:hypothetical protein